MGRVVRSALAMMAIGLALPAGARAADTYIVELTDAPLAAYDGGVKGIPGTSPQVTGRKLKADSAPGLDYRSYLAGRQAHALDQVSGAAPKVVYSYRAAFAGFAAEMTAGQAAQLKAQPDVAGVWKSELEHVMDDPDARLGSEGPAYLGLSTPTTGLWDKLGGPEIAGGAGAGVIVADIDTGIQPGHPSFAEDPAKGFVGDPFTTLPAVWHGTCQTGPGFTAQDCNHKLIGARFFVSGFVPANLAPDSYLSPRDDDGHGTHTASTAAGNYGVDPKIGNNDLGIDVISGIAPRAWVAAYKVCWNGITAALTGCASADVVAAINQAVADGVDVINMSLGNDTSASWGAQEAALLTAANAGVFVANSAGNAGPTASTVGAPSSVPWTTSVAASTLHRSLSSTITATHAGTTTTLKGASVSDALPDTPIVDGASAGLAGQNAELCKPGTLDPLKVAGKVVLCVRGDNDRVDKSHNVSLAQGVGMILYNATDAQELDADTHWVPTVHVSHADGLTLKNLIAAGDTSVAMTAGAVDTSQQPRVLAAFSSRGPQTAVPDIPKPDLSAPGVQIIAGAADQPSLITEEPTGQLFMSDQGTSMSAPQVAGAGALLTQVRPTLSPAEIKSELMLTANPNVKKENGVDTATPFDVGSGEIDPDRAASAGLVMDATLDDYVQYLEFLDPTIVSGDIPKKRPSDLNLPAISWSRFVGKDATVRTFRSIDPATTVWNVALQAPPGTTGTVTSSTGAAIGSFEIHSGQKQSLTVTLTRTDAPLNAYTFGALVLTNGDRTLRLPISVKPVMWSVTSPVTASTDQAAGSAPVTAKPGFSGPLSGLGWGLAAPDTSAGRTITRTTGRRDLTGADPGTQIVPFTVATGAQLLSARISNATAGADLDLFVYRYAPGDNDLTHGTLVGSSTRNDSAEVVNVAFPSAGRYAMVVVAFATAATGATYDLTDWVVADSAPDDPSAAPGLVATDAPGSTMGEPQTLRAQWSGVTAKGLYLGVITYHATDAPTLANASAMSIFELTKTVDDPVATPTPTPTPTPTVTATPAATASPQPTVAPPPAAIPTPTVTPPASKPPKLAVRSVKLSGRTLTLRLANARGALLRATVHKSGHVVASAPGRRASAASTLKLRLSRQLARGRYTLDVVAVVDGRASTVLRVALQR